MRIASKQVRYAMELLAGAFYGSFRRELYATFAEVQEKLGTINDHATAVAMFNKWHDRADYSGSRAELAELIANENTMLNAQCQRFRDWWTTERATELADHFATLLRISSSSTTDHTPLREPRKEDAQGIEGVASVGDEAPPA
jgi:CHAD domain-containing protein